MNQTAQAPAPRAILLTGFPTFTARYLLQHILQTEPDAKITCIVRKDRMERATASIAAADLHRVELLEGSIHALDLGLTGKQYMELVRKTTDVYHLDSLWNMRASRQRLHDINFRGTLNVLECIKDIQGLKRYNHFSTAYVCGNRTGVIMEEEFNEGQTFLNPFEQTQYEAEKEVRKHMGDLPITIYRPSLIVGHSATGQVDHLSGPYALFEPMVKLAMDLPMLLPGSGAAPLNMVPVDYVVAALYALSIDERATGRTFHLVDPNPLSARRTFELVALAAGKPLPRGRLPETITRVMGRVTQGLARSLRPEAQALEDFNRWLLFNNLNTSELLRDQPHCPSFPEYVDAMVRFLQSGDEGTAQAVG